MSVEFTRIDESTSAFDRLLRRSGSSATSLESTALFVGAAFFVLGGLVALGTFWGRDLPISGSRSLGEFAAIGGAAAAFLAFLFGRFVVARSETSASTGLGRNVTHDGLAMPGVRLHWFDIGALAIAHAVIALLAWTAFSTVLELSFYGAPVFPLPASALAGVALALSGYVSFLSSVRMTPALLSLVLAVFLVVGALASMLSASDRHWWEHNLSALGMTDDLSGMTFNVTLMVAGVIVTLVARYATAALPASSPPDRRGRAIVRAGLIALGVFLAGVGLVPVNEWAVVHTTVATGMAVCFALLAITLPWLIRSVPRAFLLLGYAYVVVIAIVAGFYVTGYYNLTAVELVAACLIFSWIIVFLRTAGASEDRR